MDDSFGVNEVDGLEDLPGKVSAFGLGEVIVCGRNPLEKLPTFEVFSKNH